MISPPRQLSAEATRFRAYLIDAMWSDRRFSYVDQDCFIGSCPICAFAIGVRFAGTAPRASLNCHVAAAPRPRSPTASTCRFEHERRIPPRTAAGLER
jgi:hypothetical protein